MDTPHNYNMKSSDIAKNRLHSMKSNDKATALMEHNSKAHYNSTNTNNYIQNEIHIDNNLIWELNHNALSSKGD